MIGQTVSHYKIVKKIGQGGMGVVYEAQDLRLPRSVALKFLPPHMGADPRARKRFEHEAHAISTLDHPNVSVIHEIDETSDGHMFIVMPYYRGKTLKQLLEDGPLPVERAAEIAAQIGTGLAKAHESGVVHRDVKPGNILVTDDGIAKILDFGLAMLTDSTRVTREGVTVGTVAYMSPEQATGGDVDHRTDIWSLGVVLFELLTWQRPFRGEIDAAMIYCIINEAPMDVTALREDTPPAVADALEKALQKDPSARFQTMGEFVGELRGLSTSSRPVVAPPTAPEDISIVVLPFDDMSPDRGNEYFSDGLTDEIITDLSQVSSVRVISRNSAITLKGTTKDMKTISAELNVRYVLQGSVRKSGENVRISAHLVDSITNSNVWADKFSGTMDDVFEIQEKVSRSIVDALALRLSPQESARVGHRPIENIQAYECHLRARQEIYGWSEDSLARALKFLEKGIEIVGDNALLYASIAQVHCQYVNTGLKPFEHLATAERFVDKVLELEPESAHGHRLAGMIAYLRKQPAESASHLNQALAVEPNDADSMFWLIAISLFAGKMEKVVELVERLTKIDPLNPMTQAVPGWVHFFQGRYASALEVFGPVYESDPDNPAHGYMYAQGLIYAQKETKAFEVIDRMVRENSEHPFTQLCQLMKHALRGKKSLAAKAMTQELRAVAWSDSQYSWFVATCYALLRHNDESLDWLTHAADIGFINHPFLLEHERLLDNIRGDERFAQLLSRIKKEWEGFAV